MEVCLGKCLGRRKRVKNGKSKKGSQKKLSWETVGIVYEKTSICGGSEFHDEYVAVCSGHVVFQLTFNLLCTPFYS